MSFIQTVGIIGYGKFGNLLQKIFEESISDVKVKFYSRSNEIDSKLFYSFEEICNSDLIIPAVPISAFEKVTKQIAEQIKKESIFLDVCSIKVHPKEVMLNVLPEQVQQICSHPMFGPASYKQNNKTFKGFNLVIENLNAEFKIYEYLKEVFRTLGINVIEMTADEHDKKASEFQFTALTVAHILKSLNMKRTQIDTASASKMHDFLERIGADLEIVEDMYKYNPYCKKQLDKFVNSTQKVISQITNLNLKIKESP